MNKLTETQKITCTAIFTALGILIPLFTSHIFGLPGTILLPMHLPVLLCGLICGAKYGFLCGLLSPALSSLLTGMPAAYPMLPIMIVELSVYGIVTGLTFKKSKLPIYISLPMGLAAGRIAYGLMFYFLLLLNSNLKAPSVFTAVSVGMPGIIIQLLIIPLVINAINPQFRKGVKLMFASKAVRLAKEKLQSGEATLCVINQGKIVLEDSRFGITGIINIYSENKEALNSAIIVDKVIGKAAASVMVLGKVSAVYGLTISRCALALLTLHGVKTKYDTLVDAIIKPNGEMCLMEQTVLNIDQPDKAYEALKAKLEMLASKNVK